MISRKWIIRYTGIFIFIIMLTPWNCRADEGGVPFWISGQFASFAAVPKTLGWSLPTLLYVHNGAGNLAQTYATLKTIAAGIQPTYAPKIKIFGGQPALALGFGGAFERASISSLSPINRFNIIDSTAGNSDLYPIANLAWNQGVNNEMIYVAGDIPVGSYQIQERLANIGIGHGAVDTGGGYTYFNKTTGIEGTAVIGFTYNGENRKTHYRNGIDSHLDYDLSKFFTKQLQGGIAGYVYYQLTPDTGAGNFVGAFKSGIAAIGPELGYLFKVGNKQWYANIRGYYQYWSQNRVRGYELFATLNITL